MDLFNRLEQARLAHDASGRKVDAVRAARGFHGMVTRPTLFLAGEAGRERVDITPGGGGAASNVTFNIYDAADAHRVVRVVDKYLRKQGVLR